MQTNTAKEQLREIAARIKEMREIMGWSVEEMAEKTEVSVEIYKMYESGAADSEIAATIGWTLSQVRHWRQKAGLKKAPGWNMSSGRTSSVSVAAR